MKVMDSAEESSFAEVNKLVRERRWRAALDLLEELKQTNSAFPIYRKTYAQIRNQMALPQGLGDGDPLALKITRDAIHPASQIDSPAPVRRMVVVTPVFNGQPHLRHTVETILSQEGDFFLDYRIQDGCSSDDGLAMLLDVQERIRSGALPLRCRGVRVLIESRPDRGLYDAVAAGFSHAGPLPDRAEDVFTYLNADDEMLPGSFQTAANVMQAVGAEWVCGQIRIIDTAGNLLRTPRFPLAYSRQDILEGKHLGYLYFLQQEGTFWTRSLYEKAGGIHPALRLAGDYDLWRRFAAHSELLAVDRPLASFRSRPGQLSEDLESYYEEIRSRGLLPRRHWQFLSRPHRGLEPPAERERMAALEQQAAGSFFARVPWELRSRSFAGAGDQREGPLCFLNERGEVREVVYLRRTWFGQETV